MTVIIMFFPKKWTGQIAVLKDTDKHIREIYRYDGETASAADMLISFVTVKLTDKDVQKYLDEGFTEITRDEISVYLCKIGETAAEQGINTDVVKQNFKLTE